MPKGKADRRYTAEVKQRCNSTETMIAEYKHGNGLIWRKGFRIDRYGRPAICAKRQFSVFSRRRVMASCSPRRYWVPKARSYNPYPGMETSPQIARP